MKLPSLAKNLMEKAVRFASDATCIIRISGASTYDPISGTVVEDTTDYTVDNPLFGPVNEIDVKRYSLTETTHTVIIAERERQKAGVGIPGTGDYVLINGRKWNIEKVTRDSMESGLIIFVHEA